MYILYYRSGSIRSTLLHSAYNKWWSLSKHCTKVLDYNMVYNDNINGSAAEANYTVANKVR